MNETSIDSGREQRFQEALVACLDRVEAGMPLTQEELSSRYPEFAAELSEFVANREHLDQLAAPLRQAAQVRTERCPTNDLDGTAAEKAADEREVGTKLRYFGDYELLQEIARGGMGIVYRARQVSLNRIVALKMILAGAFAAPADVQRFRQEAEAAANLDHPHIVPIYEVGAYQEHHYFSMKLVPGGNLVEVLPQFKELLGNNLSKTVLLFG
jgi:hypothetical protein